MIDGYYVLICTETVAMLYERTTHEKRGVVWYAWVPNESTWRPMEWGDESESAKVLRMVV